MKIRNVGGMQMPRCRCGSLLNHWKNFSGRELPYYCPVVGCAEDDLTGALVQIVSSVDSGWYVVPLCKKHCEQKESALEIDDYCKLVSANVSMTCELYK